MHIVQAFGEENESDKFSEINAQHRKANIDSVAFSIFFPVVEMLAQHQLPYFWLGIGGVVKVI